MHSQIGEFAIIRITRHETKLQFFFISNQTLKEKKNHSTNLFTNI